MSYRWVEHTGEMQMELEAGSEEALFAEALHALAGLVADDTGGEPLLREVAVDAQERAALLVGWLDELIYLSETEDFVPEQAERIELTDRGLIATVRGHRGSPRHLIKGATYHGLEFERSGHGFRATVVLDV